MIRNSIKTALAALVMAGTFPGLASANQNFMVDFNAQNGTITVEILETAATPTAFVSIHCSGVCPEVEPGMLNPATETIQLNQLVVDLPPVMVVGVPHVHNLSFWDDLFFPKGVATFSVCAHLGDLKKKIGLKGRNCDKVSVRSKGAVVAIPVPEPKIKLRQ